MFQFSFVFCTFIKLFHKAETPLGENFFKQKKNNRSCETDKVRKLSKHKHVAKICLYGTFLYVFHQFASALIKSK